MSCSTYFTDFIAKCNDTINVYAQLPSLPLYDSYRWVITDKNDHKYEGSFLVDENGFWEMAVEDLPEGLLTQYGGDFKLEVYDSSCKPVKFKIAQEYDCIRFNVKGGTFTKDYIGCSFNCVPTPAGQSALVPFSEEETVTINWAPYLSTYGNSPVVQVYHSTGPDTYQLVDVQIEQIFTDGVLSTININNGGANSGYVVIS